MKSETEDQMPQLAALEPFRREQARLASLITQLRRTIGSASVVIDADLVEEIRSVANARQESMNNPHHIGAIRA